MSKADISVSSLKKNFSWCDAELPDAFLIITNSTLTTQTRNWINKVRKAKHYRICSLEGPRLDQIILDHDKLVKKFINEPDEFFTKTVLLLLDSAPESKEYGLDLFANSLDRTAVMCKLGHIIDADGPMRTTAAESVHEIVKKGLYPAAKAYSLIKPTLKLSHKVDDDYFSNKLKWLPFMIRS